MSVDKQEHFRKLFIGGLSYDTTDDGLKGHFEKWGEIVDCVVMRDPNTKKSRGFGFITYRDASMVDEAQASRPHVIDGREVEPKRAVPREESGKPESHMSVKKIFIGGIKDEMDEADIKAYFSDFGNIEQTDIIMDKETRKKRGFGFITFDDYDAVDKLVLLKHHNIAGFRVEVKKAVSKQEMQGAMEGGRGGRGGRGGGRGGRGRGGGGGGYGGNQGGGYGGNQSGGYGGNQGGGSYGGNQGGYGGGNQSWGGNQGGGNQSWGNQGGNSSYGGGQSWGGNQGYSQGGQGGGSWNSGGGDAGNFGSNYNNSSYSGAQRGGNYNQRSSGPYGGGYGSGGGSGGGNSYGSGGGNYNNRR